MIGPQHETGTAGPFETPIATRHASQKEHHHMHDRSFSRTILMMTAAVVGLMLAPLSRLEATATAADPAAAQTITVADLRGHVAFLSSEELAGRGLGEPGGYTAHRYLASYYTRLGMIPFGEDGTFLQPFEARGDKIGRNVLAMIPGTDPKLREEFIVIAGHVDHLGRGRSGDGEVYNGADDNASGTAAILEIAEAFTAAPTKRSIVFFNTDGEESGLLGSRHWVKNPTFPVDSIAAFLCMDMIGRSVDDYVFIGGTGTSPAFPDLVDRMTKKFGFKAEIAEGGQAPTDSAALYKEDCPILFFFTNLHDDYHRPSDDIEKLNFEGLSEITRMIFLTAHELANADERPEFTRSDGMAMPKDFMERARSRMMRSRAASPYLGVEPALDATGSGFVIGKVAEGSAAERASLQAGDRIIGIDDDDIEDFRGLRRSLGEKKVGQEILLKVQRADERFEVKVELGSMGGTPTR